MAKRPARSSDQSPAGAPAEQAAVDRRWRLYASGAIAAAIVSAGVLGLLIIPAGQREKAGLSFYEAVCRAVGLTPGSPAQAQPVSRAASLPVSRVAWDPEVMRILASGNTRRGAAVAAETCAACHGDKGLSQTNIPSLAGQTPEAIYKQLHDYRSGARAHESMTGVAKALPVADLAAVAAYFAAASKEYTAIGARDLIGEAEIEKLAREGARRGVPGARAEPLLGQRPVHLG